MALMKQHEFHAKTYSKFAIYKEAFLNDENNDAKILRWFFMCGRYTGLTPFVLHGKRYAAKVVIFILCLAFSVYIYFSVSFRIQIYGAATVVFTVVNVIWSFMQWALIIVCLLTSNVFLMKHWNLLLKTLAQVEMLLRKLGFQVTRKMYAFYCDILVSFVPIWSLHIYQYEIFLRSSSYSIAFHCLIWLVADFYLLLILLFTCNMSQFISRRLVFINDKILKVIESTNSSEIIILKLNKIISLYMMLYKLMEYYNKIFGWHLFILIASSATYVIVAIEYVLDRQDTVIFSSYLLMLCYCIIYVAVILILVVCCDSVERNGKKILSTCYLLHQRVKNDLVKEKLLELAEYVEECRPSFSAAGFYNINQSSLSTVFEAVITYLVIAIQFNLTLRT